MGYDGLHDLIENERAEKHSTTNIKAAMDNFDVSLVRKRFPSIIVGSSPRLELYDGATNFCQTRSLLETQSCEDFLSNSILEEQGRLNVNETWHSLDSALPCLRTFSPSEDHSATLHISHPPTPVTTEKNSNQPATLKEPVGLESQIDAASIELLLDRSISCIPGLRKKHCRQLEDCGFHTVGFLNDCLKVKAPCLECLLNTWILGLHWSFMLPCSSYGKCCTIFLGPMLIYRMLRLELMMDGTLFLLGRSCLRGNIFQVFLTIFLIDVRVVLIFFIIWIIFCF